MGKGEVIRSQVGSEMGQIMESIRPGQMMRFCEWVRVRLLGHRWGQKWVK